LAGPVYALTMLGDQDQASLVATDVARLLSIVFLASVICDYLCRVEVESKLASKMVLLFSALTVLEDVSILSGESVRQTDALCKLQGFFSTFFGLAKIMWTVQIVLLVYFYFVRRRRESALYKFVWPMFGLSIGFGLTSACVVLAADSYGETGVNCWITGDLAMFFGYYLWVGLAFFFNMGMLALFMIKKQGRTQSPRWSGPATTNNTVCMSKSISYKKSQRTSNARTFQVPIGLMWNVLIISMVVLLKCIEQTVRWVYGYDFGIEFLASFVSALSGFLHALVWCHPLHFLIKRTFQTKEQRQYTQDIKDGEPSSFRLGLEYRQVKVCIASWNMGGAPPPDNVADLLLPGHDVYILAVQECMHFEQLKKTVDPNLHSDMKYEYKEKKIGSTRRELGYHGIIGLMAWVSEGLIEQNTSCWEKDMATNKTKRGKKVAFQTMSNKGCVGLAFRFWQTSVAFVGCHLTSDAIQKSQVDKRNKDAQEILRKMQFDYEDLGFDFPDTQHVCFVLGDLNYRMSGSPAEVMATIAKAHCKLKPEVQDEAWDKLHNWDQLKSEMEKQEVFHGFNEHEIRFPPTYRRNRGADASCANFSDVDSISKAYSTEVEKKGQTVQRTPSYTDRILWHTLPFCREHVKCIAYTQCESIRTSDHNPVSAHFIIDANTGTAMEGDTSEDGKLAISRVLVNLSEAEWLPLHEQSDPASTLEVVFPIPAEDPMEMSRKLSEFRTALNQKKNDRPRERNCWRIPLSLTQTKKGRRLKASTCHVNGMHLLVRLLADSGKVVGQGVLSLRDFATSSLPGEFDIAIKRGGKRIGSLTGTVSCKWRIDDDDDDVGEQLSRNASSSLCSEISGYSSCAESSWKPDDFKEGREDEEMTTRRNDAEMEEEIPKEPHVIIPVKLRTLQDRNFQETADI